MSKWFWLKKEGWAQLWPQQKMLPSWVTGKIGCFQGSMAVPKSYYSHCFLYNAMSVKKINVSLWCPQLSRKTSLSLWVHAFLLQVIQHVSGKKHFCHILENSICYPFCAACWSTCFSHGLVFGKEINAQNHDYGEWEFGRSFLKN